MSAPRFEQIFSLEQTQRSLTVRIFKVKTLTMQSSSCKSHSLDASRLRYLKRVRSKGEPATQRLEKIAPAEKRKSGEQ